MKKVASFIFNHQYALLAACGEVSMSSNTTGNRNRQGTKSQF